MKKYETIIAYIRNRMDSGELKEGDQLETEEQLSVMFGCSRPTVRQATGILEQEGILTRITGRGTFVTRPKMTQEYTRFIESYPLTVKKQSGIPKTEVLDFHVETADAFIQNKLGLTSRQQVYYLKRLRYNLGSGENRPVLLTEVYLPQTLLPDLLNYDFEKVSLYDVLREYDYYPQDAIRYIEAQMPDARTAAILQMPQHEPVQVISSTSTVNGKIIEYSRSVYPASRNRFIVEIHR